MKKFESLIDKGLIEIIKNSDVLESAVKIAFNQENGKLGFISPADAFFHSTALHVEGVFLTNDKKHYNKTKDTIGKILLLEDY